jgi:CBS domain-containing protein
MENIAVSSIMTKQIVAITLSEDIERAETLFKRYKIKHIPVVSNDVIVGMLSYTDLMRISIAETKYNDEHSIDSIVFNHFTIEQVMTKTVVTVTSETSIKEAAKILVKNEFHALPVVDDGDLVGIVTTTDILNYLIKEL